MGGFSRTQVRSHKSRKNRKKRGAEAPLFFVRPAGRTCLEVRVLYPPGKGKG